MAVWLLMTGSTLLLLKNCQNVWINWNGYENPLHRILLKICNNVHLMLNNTFVYNVLVKSLDRAKKMKFKMVDLWSLVSGCDVPIVEFALTAD